MEFRIKCQESRILKVLNPFQSLIFLTIAVLVQVAGRRCFSCSTMNDYEQFDCLYNAENVTLDSSNNISTVYCPFYCTIQRQEYADAPGGINFLNRSCEEEKMDEVYASGYFITYLRSCKSDLCNSGDGIESLKNLAEDEDEEFEYDFPESSSSDSSNSLIPSHLFYGFNVFVVLFYS